MLKWTHHIKKGPNWLVNLWLLSLIYFYVPSLWAYEFTKIDINSPINIRANEIIFDEKAKSYLATGEVEVVYENYRVFANRMQVNPNTFIVEAEGEARINTLNEVLIGERILIDLDNNKGKIYNGLLFTRPFHYYLFGEEIKKIGIDSYHVRYGSFTTCDDPNPAWEVTGHEITVSVDGYGYAYNSAFRIKKIPFFWIPYLIFPVKFKCQSGLLSPILGYSQRDGFFLSQPWYQILDNSHDLTLTLNYMTKRGIDIDLEYRYILDQINKGLIILNFMPNDHIAQNLKDTFKNDDNWYNRYWLRGKIDQSLYNKTIFLKINLDLVGDRDFLQEFNYGHTSYEKTKNNFSSWLDGNIDPATSTIRENRIVLQKYYPTSILNLNVIYYDNLLGNNKETLHYLPIIYYDIIRQTVGKTTFYFQMTSAYMNYYREENSRGHIIDINPSLSLPINLNDYFELEPKLTCIERIYNVTRDLADINEPKVNGLNTFWNFSTTFSSYLYQNLEFNLNEELIQIKHILHPKFTYIHIPTLNQEKISLLALYNYSNINIFSYGIDNILTNKKNKQIKKDDEEQINYYEFLRLAIFHSFDINQTRISKNQTIGTYSWGTVDTRIQFYPNTLLLMQTETSWIPYNNRWESISTLFRAKDQRGDSITIDYQFTENMLKQVAIKFKIAITKEWFASWLNHKDLENNNIFQGIYELGYENQCWGIKTFYQDDFRQKGIFLAFSLGGFGEIINQGWLK